jgi:NAD(P)-dependent dehydrogenase (short-subunit alcohol dehydrogenase family)
VFISGAAAASAKAWSKHSWARARVVFCDIAVDQGEAVAARLAQGDAPAPLFLECDLRDSGAIAAVIAEAEAHLGGIDVVINNAGTMIATAWKRLRPPIGTSAWRSISSTSSL